MSRRSPPLVRRGSPRLLSQRIHPRQRSVERGGGPAAPMAPGWACSVLGDPAPCSAQSKAADRPLVSPGWGLAQPCFSPGSPAPSLTLCTLGGGCEAEGGGLWGAVLELVMQMISAAVSAPSRSPASPQGTHSSLG